MALEHGYGPKVQDVDGHWYYDLIGALGAVPLGYGHPDVVRPVESQLASGILFGLPHRLEGEVSELFCERIPCARNGAVKWLKTGSEACAAAIRMARAYTGRDLVLMADNGYHGWHDWYVVTKPQHPGVPDLMGELVQTFPYNRLDRLCDALDRNPGAFAAVILEPALFTPPDDGFLAGVVEWAHHRGTVVIFDEMILGGRMAYAGGQQHFEVTPDLATFGKAIGGIGYPVACVCGKREIVERGVTVSGTFGGDALALTAVKAAAHVYDTQPIIFSQWTHGTVIMDALKRALDDCEVAGVVDGYPVHPRLTFSGSTSKAQMSLFLQECAERGVLWHPGGINVPGILTEADLTAICAALRAAVEAVADGVPLRGQVIQDAQIRPAGRTA